LPGDIWATVSHAMGIAPDTVRKTRTGRPMRMTNGGTPISELIG
jgi:hypothetical protein